jgi:uncharacterized protein (TIGR02466 family)
MLTQPFFSVLISTNHYDKNKDLCKELSDYCLNIADEKKNDVATGWISSSTFNTLDLLNVVEEDKFKNINEWVLKKVNAHGKLIGYPELKAVSGWFNVYNKYDFQEFHTHSMHHLSCIYFLKSDAEKDAKVFFTSPIYDVANKPQSNENNPMTWDKVLFKPAQGTLIIFPSWVRHCVERQENNGPRISLAYNFDLCS